MYSVCIVFLLLKRLLTKMPATEANYRWAVVYFKATGEEEASSVDFVPVSWLIQGPTLKCHWPPTTKITSTKFLSLKKSCCPPENNWLIYPLDRIKKLTGKKICSNILQIMQFF